MMQNAPQNINQIPSEPELKDLLDLLEKRIKLGLNCHHIGKIQSFDALTQTAKVTINYTKTFSQINSVGEAKVITANYPTLIDCPVICLGGGLGSLTFPISSGDECLVLFNDRDIDNWFSGSSSSAPATPRTHAFPDAIILVGVRSLANVLPAYVTDAVTLTYQGNLIQIFSSKVLITLTGGTSLELDATGKLKITNSTGEFVAALVQLFTDIQNANTNTMLGPQPLIMPTFATDFAKLQSFEG